MIDIETNDFHGAMNRKVTSVPQSMQTKKMTKSITGSTQCNTHNTRARQIWWNLNVPKSYMAKSDFIQKIRQHNAFIIRSRPIHFKILKVYWEMSVLSFEYFSFTNGNNKICVQFWLDHTSASRYGPIRIEHKNCYYHSLN